MHYSYQSNGQFVGDDGSVVNNTQKMNVGDTYDSFDSSGNHQVMVITKLIDLGFTVIVQSVVSK